MLYRINPRYTPCVWQKNNHALIDTENGRHIHIAGDMLAVIELCLNGQDLNSIALMLSYGQAIKRLIQKGYILPGEKGEKQNRVSFPCEEIHSVQWSITGKCNAACRHCFLNAPGNTENDLSFEEVLRVLKELNKIGVTRVSLTGGEPLVREDLGQILGQMRAHGIFVSGLSTNGFLLTDKMLDTFEENGMKPEVQISFDGVGCHDLLRGVKGAEGMAVNAIERCVRRGLNVTAAMCIHKGNSHSIRKTILKLAQMGCNVIRLCPVGEIGQFKRENGVECYSASEMLPIYLNVLKDFISDAPPIILNIQGVLASDGRNPREYKLLCADNPCADKQTPCRHMRNMLYITQTGRILPCIALSGTAIENTFPSILENGILPALESEAYRSIANLSLSDILKQNPGCADCEHLSKCLCGCRGAALAIGNGLMGIDKSRCTAFKENWAQKIRAVYG